MPQTRSCRRRDNRSSRHAVAPLAYFGIGPGGEGRQGKRPDGGIPYSSAARRFRLGAEGQRGDAGPRAPHLPSPVGPDAVAARRKHCMERIAIGTSELMPPKSNTSFRRRTRRRVRSNRKQRQTQAATEVAPTKTMWTAENDSTELVEVRRRWMGWMCGGMGSDVPRGSSDARPSFSRPNGLQMSMSGPSRLIRVLAKGSGRSACQRDQVP